MKTKTTPKHHFNMKQNARIAELNSVINALEPSAPAIIGLNYDYNKNEETGRTSVTLNGLMVAIVSRTDTPDLFKVNMVNIATDSIEIIGRDEAKRWIDRQVTRFLFGCYKKISM